MSLALLEDAADSASGGVLFVAEGVRVAEFVAAVTLDVSIVEAY
jgi:hypothetical protein